MIPDLNDAWLGVSERILRAGLPAVCRGRETLEILGAQSIVDMNRPVLSFLSRKLSYKFMCAEAWWILSGGYRLDAHPLIEKNWKKYSDDGITTSGAYGPKIVPQIPYIVNLLNSDPTSRQAVINIWRENPEPAKDIACTTSTQFILREGVLHLIHTMRSSDIWLGYPYDIFNFTMLAAYIALHLNVRPRLGVLIFTAGSQHLYKDNYIKFSEARMKRRQWKYEPLKLYEFKTPDCLLQHLHNLSINPHKISQQFLKELQEIIPDELEGQEKPS